VYDLKANQLPYIRFIYSDTAQQHPPESGPGLELSSLVLEPKRLEHSVCSSLKNVVFSSILRLEHCSSNPRALEKGSIQSQSDPFLCANCTFRSD